jgi:hypothetical protein
MTWVLTHSEAAKTDRLVLLTIANYARADGSNAYPSVEQLAYDCRMSDRQVIRILQRLVRDGHLVLTGRSSRRTKVYAIAGMGDKLSPTDPDKLSPPKVTFSTPKVTSRAFKGDIAMSPDPSGTISDPSYPSGPSRARARDGGAMTRVIAHLEGQSGRPWSAWPGSKLWATLEADLRDFGLDRVIAAMQAIETDHPDHGQLVFGATRRLHPIDSTPSRGKPGGHTRSAEEVTRAFNR